MRHRLKNRFIKSAISAALAAALALCPAGFSRAAPGGADSGSAPGAPTASVTDKSEVVYAALSSDGGVRAVYVVNHFEVSGAGSVTDYGDYSSVTNLSSTEPLARDGDAVSFTANAGDFYYQGNMSSSDLPWVFELSYYLDGAPIPPQELAGKSGRLEIRLKSSRNNSVDPVFYECYMLQISLTLDTERCGGIEAPGATVAAAGKNKLITYTVMPGRDADIAVSADVRDFVMTGVDISAMPFSLSVELPDTSGLTGRLEQLAGAISALCDGVGELAGGAAGLKKGAEELQKGSSGMLQGLSELSGSSGRLADASAQIDGALARIASSLSEGMPADLSGLARLPEALAQLAAGLGQISGGLAELKTGFTPAYLALDAAIRGIPDTAVTQEQLAALYANTDPGQHWLLDELTKAYAAGQIAKGTYNQVKGAFDAVGVTIDALTGGIDSVAGTLESISEELDGALSGADGLRQLDELASGLAELAKNYGEFHSGLKEYADGVRQAAGGYAELHSGVAALGGGIGGLKQGADELYDGVGELKEETSDMPGQVQSEIEKMMDEYLGPDFEPVSFTSPKNENTGLVQFVLKCDGVEKAKTESVSLRPKDETFWDRLVALFKGKDEEAS